MSAQTGWGTQETYAYDDAGRLASVEIGGVTRAQTYYDLLGRVTSYAEYDGSGTTAHNRYDIVYDARGLALAEKTITRQGSGWLRTHTVNYYGATGTGGAQPVVTSAGQTGSATGNLLFHYGDTCSDP